MANDWIERARIVFRPRREWAKVTRRRVPVEKRENSRVSDGNENCSKLVTGSLGTEIK